MAQEALLHEFNLERHVPADHLLRSIDRFVNLSSIRQHLRPFYSETGPLSIDSELMIRMLIMGSSHAAAPRNRSARSPARSMKALATSSTSPRTSARWPS